MMKLDVDPTPTIIKFATFDNTYFSNNFGVSAFANSTLFMPFRSDYYQISIVSVDPVAFTPTLYFYLDD